MADFIFNVSPPAIDHNMVSLIDPQLTFAAAGNDEWKEQYVQQLGWSIVDLPDDLFASSASAATVRKLFRVFQGAIQYCRYKEQRSLFQVGQYKGKLKEAKEELSELFDELVELREATALMRLGRRGGEVRKKASSSRRRDDAPHATQQTVGFSCYMCGNAYPSAGPLQSHLRKRHAISADLAQHAAARCGTDVFHAAVQASNIDLERVRATQLELSAIRGEVSTVKQSVSELMRTDAEVQRELEHSRNLFSTSLTQFQQMLANSIQQQQRPPQVITPPPVQLVMPPQFLQQPAVVPPSIKVDDDGGMASLMRLQELRIESMERNIREMKEADRAALWVRNEETARRHSLRSASAKLTSAAQTALPSSSPPPAAQKQRTAAAVQNQKGSERYAADANADDDTDDFPSPPSHQQQHPSVATRSDIARLDARPPSPVPARLDARPPSPVPQVVVHASSELQPAVVEPPEGTLQQPPPPGTAPIASTSPTDAHQAVADTVRMSVDGAVISSASSSTSSSSSSSSSSTATTPRAEGNSSTRPTAAAIDSLVTVTPVPQEKQKKKSLLSRLLAKVSN